MCIRDRLNPLTYVIINVAIIALIWIGAIRVDMGIITQGAVVALYNYMSQILTELIKLANLIINITTVSYTHLDVYKRQDKGV